MVRCVVNTRHKPARAPQLPSTCTPCANSAHRYQNKGFVNQNSEFLSPLFSHSCAHLRPQTLCFDMLHKNRRGEGVTPVAIVRSRIGMGRGSRHKRAEGSLSRLCGIGMTEGGKRDPRAARLPDRVGVNARRTWGAGVLRPYKGKRNPRTGPASGTGHYIGKREAGRQALRSSRGQSRPGGG